MEKRVLIGIDDTDNKTSKGTGFLTRKLAIQMEKMNLAVVVGISRHQLLVDPRIPYTSQNSSACLDVNTNDVNGLTDFIRSFLISESADGSDVGLAIVEYNEELEKVVIWGQRAKKEVLTQDEAIIIAQNNDVFLEGLTGTKDGIIGALAGIGLRISGNDGRFIWLAGKEIREISGIYVAQHLIDDICLDQIQEKSGYLIPLNDKIEVGNWVRPVINNNRVIVIVENSNNTDDHEWKIADKEYIKSFSN